MHSVAQRSADGTGPPGCCARYYGSATLSVTTTRSGKELMQDCTFHDHVTVYTDTCCTRSTVPMLCQRFWPLPIMSQVGRSYS
eukprot:6198823-Pleurochrysis_carterae.AAC.11